jgi:hypothetical protein
MHRFEFYLGMIRRTIETSPGQICYASATSDMLSPIVYRSPSTPCQVIDTQLAATSAFYLGDRVLTISTASVQTGCFEIWMNGSHLLEQGNQKRFLKISIRSIMSAVSQLFNSLRRTVQHKWDFVVLGSTYVHLFLGAFIVVRDKLFSTGG